MTLVNMTGRSIKECSSNLHAVYTCTFTQTHKWVLGDGYTLRLTHTHVKFQKALSLGVRWVWFREYVFPLTLPIHTSNPASDRMKAKLSLTRLVNQLVEEHRRPCWRKNTGLVILTRSSVNKRVNKRRTLSLFVP